MLEGNNILLRDIEIKDLNLLFDVENNPLNWNFGGEQRKFAKQELLNYIENAKTDIRLSKQYRFVIEHKNNAIGFIDLFNYTVSSIGVGIIIIENYRKRGFAKEALKLLINYVFNELKVNKLFANIATDNIASINLFISCGFQETNSEGSVKYFVKLATNNI